MSAKQVWFLEFWGRKEHAFLTEQEAIEYSELHPHNVHKAGMARDETVQEFSTVVEGTLPAIVKCKTCKEHGVDTIVTAEDPKKYPYCVRCFYMGAAAEHLMADVLVKYNKALPGYEASVGHTGGGCFALYISRVDDERKDGLLTSPYYMITGDDFEVATIAVDGVGCIGKYQDETEDNKTHEYPGQRACLIYEGYDEGGPEESKIRKITVAQSIRKIAADIKKPAPFTETF